MSETYTEITLKNAWDVGAVEHGIIKASEVHTTTVQALVDTGAWTLVISEALCTELGLKIRGTSESTFANGETVMSSMSEGIEVHWEDRSMICDAVVLPGADEVLLGAIPLEGMDLIVDPRREKVTGRHGDKALHTLKGTRRGAWRRFRPLGVNTPGGLFVV
jgi:clan AA aspartic protease